MTDIDETILLYSKYSPQSKRLLEKVQRTTELRSLLKINDLCVDNEEIRKRVIQNTMYGIKGVPCFIVKTQSNEIMTFEGPKAFSWIDEITQNIEHERKQKEIEQLKILQEKQMREQRAEQERMEKAQLELRRQQEEEALQNKQRYEAQRADLTAEQLQNKPIQPPDIPHAIIEPSIVRSSATKTASELAKQMEIERTALTLDNRQQQMMYGQ